MNKALYYLIPMFLECNSVVQYGYCLTDVYFTLTSGNAWCNTKPGCHMAWDEDP